MQTVSPSLLTAKHLSGFRNAIINGAFDVWQRGSTAGSTDAQGFLADKWNVAASAMTVSQSRQAFLPGAIEGDPAFAWQGIVADAAGNSAFALLTQTIESVRAFSGRSAVLSFWARADAARPMAVELMQQFGTGGSPTAPVTSIGATQVMLSTTWTKYTVPVDVPSIAGATLGTNGDDSLRLNLWLSAGSDFAARTGALGHQSGTFLVTRVQIEPGSEPTAFEMRPPALEVSLCQRYAQVFGAASSTLAVGVCTSTTNLRAVLNLMRPMRAAPTLTVRGGIGNFSAGPGGQVASALAIGNVSGSLSILSLDMTSAALTANAVGVLTCGSAAASLLFSADLP